MDLNLFKANKGIAVESSTETNAGRSTNGASAKDSLADEDANLMIKLKFLTYKV